MVKVKLNRHAFELALSRKNLSQSDLAEQIGFSRSHLSHIFNGRRDASPAIRTAAAGTPSGVHIR